MDAWLFPGQGSQARGMGADVLARYPDLVRRADELLGYSVRELCERDPDRRLRDTRYAQPALFVVHALTYLARVDDGGAPDVVAGHSLGEYGALFAAGCFDFDTGLRLVHERGRLMGEVTGGGMMAIIGLPMEQLAAELAEDALRVLDVANHNEPAQVVISGPQPALRVAADRLAGRAGVRCVPLNVSAPFHSRYMADAAARFARVLTGVTFREPRLPVISNVTARPYPPGAVADLLGRQIRSAVRWWDTVRWLREHGVTGVAELGPGTVLSRIWRTAETVPAAAPAAGLPARVATAPAPSAPAPSASPAPASPAAVAGPPAVPRPVRAELLGSAAFRRAYGVRYAYLSGSMYQGIGSVDLVLRMGRAGLLGFFGAGGLTLDEIDDALGVLGRELGRGGPYGANLLHAVDDPDHEAAVAALYVRHGVRFVEAAGYTGITAPLVHARFAGAHRDAHGRPVAVRNVLAKVSRPEVAEKFLRPPEESLLRRLVDDGRLTTAEADVARELPVSADVCVESDSGGHTDAGVALTLLPTMSRLRDRVVAEYRYPERPRIGAAGGLGAPEAVAAAFTLGAEFVVTGSVNQCSPQAGTSPAVKDILATLDVQDTTYAPAGDMFELGARVQVVRKGTLFPARANRLYQLYRQHESLGDIDARTRRTIEDTYFRRSFDEVWDGTRRYLQRRHPEQIPRANRQEKHRMALVFRWYFVHSSRMALRGVLDERVNFQIHTGPAIGAFNRFVDGTDLADWRDRHVDVIAERLMEGAAALLGTRYHQFTEGATG
ncbi:ACP S-malonyltransferase [Micromonospora tulbaghiae]|uniref:ACP S-malonyltransferase n=1 Tax=Micromonospora tulbaghiae TaxID=479978 RepID=UPI003713FD71